MARIVNIEVRTEIILLSVLCKFSTSVLRTKSFFPTEKIPRSFRKWTNNINCARIEPTGANVREIVLEYVLSTVRLWKLSFFIAHNSLAINATWTGMNEAQVQWQTEKRNESYHLFVRKVTYDVTKLPIYGKWKAPPGVRPRTLHESAQEEVKDRVNGDNDDGVTKGVAAILHLNQAFTWEIRIIKKDVNESATIFIDPPVFAAYGKRNRRQSAITRGHSRMHTSASGPAVISCWERTNYLFCNFSQQQV